MGDLGESNMHKRQLSLSGECGNHVVLYRLILYKTQLSVVMSTDS